MSIAFFATLIASVTAGWENICADCTEFLEDAHIRIDRVVLAVPEKKAGNSAE